MPVLRVCTYNIRHGRGLDDRVDLERIAQTLTECGADIIGLQEVDSGWARSFGVNQAKILASLMGMHWAMGTAFTNGKAQYGNAVLSRYPISHWDTVPLSSSREPRVLLRTAVSAANHELHFMVTHLGLDRKERLAHIRQQILTSISGRNRCVLVGDLNSGADSEELGLLRQVFQDTGLSDAHLTYPSAQPAERIDHVLYTPDLTCASVETRMSAGSDHNALIAELVVN